MPADISILLKKNILLEKRSWKLFLFEVLTIVVFYTVIVVNPTVKSKIYREAEDTHFYESQTSLYDLSVFYRLQALRGTHSHLILIYAPATDLTARIVSATQRALNMGDSLGVEDEKTLLSRFNANIHLAGIIFQTVDSSDTSTTPKKFSIALVFPSNFRTIEHTESVHHLWLTRCTGVLDDSDTPRLKHEDLYLREGFLQLQHRLFMEWLRWYKGMPEPTEEKDFLDRTMGGTIPLIKIQQFKHITDLNPCFSPSTSNIIWFLYYFTFFMPFLGVIKKYSEDHEANIPTHHWIYNYETGKLRIAHFAISFLHFLLLVLLIYLLIMIEWSSGEKYHILRQVKSWVFLLFLSLYVTSLIIYAMIVATVFAKRDNSVLFGIAMWLGSYGLFSIVFDTATDISPTLLVSMFIFFNNAYPFGMKFMKLLEYEPGYKTKIWILIYAQLANIFILLFVLSIVDLIRPGRYVQRRYFNYLFIPFCCKRRAKKTSEPIPTPEAMDRPSVFNVEYGPRVAGQEILYVKSVTTYENRIYGKQQLKKVSLRLFKNEIAVILGARSTGKTRLISMMAGLKKPDKGNIVYKGRYDIYENWFEYRSMIDCSMKNNPLYDCLTVQETLYYFCEIKMMLNDKDLIASEVEKWDTLLQSHLPKDKKTLVRSLSFSQKRLLALCCALACKRCIILLDEPTCEMTTAEQRFYWHILRVEKHDRAIVITSDSIDEADAVADRITILSEGNVMAAGTPFFLKTQIGTGFNLIILKDNKSPSAPIWDLINSYITDVAVEMEIADQLIYKLPKEQRNAYQRLLIHLENHSKELGITRVQIRGSDIGEIYMTLGLKDAKDVNPEEGPRQSAESIKEYPHQLRPHQVQTMLYKKMIFQALNIMPIIMIAATIILILFIQALTKNLQYQSFTNDGIPLGFLGNNDTSREVLNNYKKCSYVEINETERPKYPTKLNNQPIYPVFKHFICGEKSYKEDSLHEIGVFNKLGAVEILESGKQMVLWVNERVFHTAALSLNLAHNLILSDLYPDETNLLTTIVNKPMIIPMHATVNLIDNQISHLRLPLTIGIIIPITMSSFVVSLIDERRTHLLTLERLAGISMGIYWIIGVLWDFGTFFAISIIYVLALVLVSLLHFGFISIFFIFILLNIHGLSSLCVIYFMSLFMPHAKYRGFLISVVIHFVFGLCAYVFYWDVMENNILLYYTLSLFPTFSLLDGIGNLYGYSLEKENCIERCNKDNKCNPENMCYILLDCCHNSFLNWSSPGILPAIAFMSVTAILSCIGFFLVNLYRREKIIYTASRAKQSHTMCYPTDDKDVIKEKVRIAAMSLGECKKYQVLVDQMENCIPRHGRVLNTVSFALERQKSLAIYGGHHSGKSHMLYQLVGEEGINFGELYICKKDTKYKTKEAWAEVGFCPQTKGLCDVVHPNQLFTLLFMIQGVPKEEASPKVKEIAKALNIRRYMSKRVAHLPSNIKRKLNIALTLIIDNKVLILDEPTRGMPAVDRRQIWNFLKNERCCGSSLVFSSCDSLECEKLSDVMIVVDNGEMLAYGSYEYLRAKYTRGIYLEVKLVADGNTKDEMDENLESDIKNMLAYVKFLHEDSKLVNRYESILKFYIPLDNVRFSYLFGSVEKNKRRLNISEYSIDMPSFLEALYNILATRRLRDQYKQKNKDSVNDPDNSKDEDPQFQYPDSWQNMAAIQDLQSQDPESSKNKTAIQDPQSQDLKNREIMTPGQAPQSQDHKSRENATAIQDSQSQGPKTRENLTAIQDSQSQDTKTSPDIANIQEVSDIPAETGETLSKEAADISIADINDTSSDLPPESRSLTDSQNTSDLDSNGINTTDLEYEVSGAQYSHKKQN